MKYPKPNEKQIKELQTIIGNNNNSTREIKRAQAILMVDKRKPIEDISEITNLKKSQIFTLNRKNKELSAKKETKI